MKINEIQAYPSKSSKSGVKQMWKHKYNAIGKVLKQRYLQSGRRNYRKQIGYVKKGTFRVSCAEERTYKLSFEEYKDFAMEKKEDVLRGKKNMYKGPYLEEANLK